VTDEELKGLAAQMANMAKTDIRNSGSGLTGVLAVYIPGIGLLRMAKYEQLAIERFGKSWTGSGEAKRHVFGVMRTVADIVRPAAIAIATACDKGAETAKMISLPLEEQERLAKETGFHDLVEQGYLEIQDAILATVHTPERVCIYTHVYLPEQGRFVGEPDVYFVPQAEFGGRLKMFGDLREENLGEVNTNTRTSPRQKRG
jgi:hypothetical protein